MNIHITTISVNGFIIIPIYLEMILDLIGPNVFRQKLMMIDQFTNKQLTTMTNLKQDFGSRYRATNDWRADVPLKTKPLIIGSRMISGVKHYKTVDKKLIVAKTFDRVWGEPKMA